MISLTSEQWSSATAKSTSSYRDDRMEISKFVPADLRKTRSSH
jgi:hypothetical protein